MRDTILSCFVVIIIIILINYVMQTILTKIIQDQVSQIKYQNQKEDYNKLLHITQLSLENFFLYDDFVI